MGGRGRTKAGSKHSRVKSSGFKSLAKAENLNNKVRMNSITNLGIVHTIQRSEKKVHWEYCTERETKRG